MSPFCLETPRTIIRPYRDADIDRVLPIFSDAITMGFWPQPFTAEQVAAWVRGAVAEYRQTGLGRMVIELRETGQVIGDCGIKEADVNGTVENDLGYIIHHPYWRQGYAVECAAAVLGYGRLRGLKRVVANMPVNHFGSERVAQHLGFTKEGEFLNARNRGIRTWLYACGF